MALRTQPFTVFVEQLGGERPFAHSGDVGLGDADHTVDLRGSDAGAGAGAACGRVRRGDERVGAVVDVEHRGLTSLEQHGLAVVERIVENERRVRHVRLELDAHLEQLLHGGLHVEGAAVVELDEHLVLLVQRIAHLVAQHVFMEQVGDADAHAVDLVGIGRTDATAGGADLLLAGEAFGHLVDHAVVGRDHMRGLAHQQARAVDAAALEPLDLLEQHLRVDHDAVAYDRSRRRADDAGWQQMQRIRLVADHHRVACVVAAVETRDVIDLGADQIGSLCLRHPTVHRSTRFQAFQPPLWV